MSIKAREFIVRRYLNDVLDNGQVDILDELFTSDCIIHRPEYPEPIVGLEHFKAFMALAFTAIISRMETTLHDIVVDDDLAACRLSHRVVFHKDAMLPTRMGPLDVGGRTVEWSAMGISRFAGGKISEEWVYKDEIGLFVQLGATLAT